MPQLLRKRCRQQGTTECLHSAYICFALIWYYFVVYRCVKGNISIIFTFAFDDLPNRLNRDSKGWPMSLDLESDSLAGSSYLPDDFSSQDPVGAHVEVWTFWDFDFVILRFIYLLFLLIISSLRTALSCILPQILDFETKAWDKWEVGTWAFHMS